ncbi:MAG TPA: NAD(P)/FAD-dependent oxidoreductase [Acidimicrobiales bacterium]|jgi:NADH dehydrogenase|nr:NAD(P)/FAD-dependent oxidoreductase [Acidimicrobiales bacterium]
MVPGNDSDLLLQGVHRVVIVGSGFGGLAAARALAGSHVAVTLIDANNFYTFQPLLYQVATAGLDPADVAFPVRAIFSKAKNVTFRHGRVDSLDLARRSVSIADGAAIEYDSLVVATGATATFFSIDGATEHARPLYTLRDARALRNSVLGVLEAADAHPERFNDGAPSFVVIGGGPTGVEMAGAIAELLDVSAGNDRLRIDRARTQVVLVDAIPRLLAAFSGKSSTYAERTLADRHVDIRLGTKVAKVDAESVTFEDGSSVRADVVIWAAGISVRGTLAEELPGEKGPGSRVVVGDDCSLVGHPEVYVIGDAAAIPLGGGRSGPAPQLAQVAIQSGRHVGEQILAKLDRKPCGPFRYKDRGIMATIGRRAAVAELTGPGPLDGLKITGTLGWLAWLLLHLIYLVGARNRIVVLLNWWWRYVGWSSGPRIIVEDVPRQIRSN